MAVKVPVAVTDEKREIQRQKLGSDDVVHTYFAASGCQRLESETCSFPYLQHNTTWQTEIWLSFNMPKFTAAKICPVFWSMTNLLSNGSAKCRPDPGPV